MGEYWDTHDAGEIWEQTGPAEFKVDRRRERLYCHVGRSLSERIAEIAREQGTSAESDAAVDFEGRRERSGI